MVLRIEKQREVSDIFTENLENTALFTRSAFTKPAGRSNGNSRTDYPKGPTRNQIHSSSKGYGSQSDSKKQFRHCDYCNNDGHVRDTCFRLHGYPGWYKEYKARTHAVVTPASTSSDALDAAHFAHLEHFVGTPSSYAFNT